MSREGNRIDHVIDSIDGALSDWSTSPDAMRWSPPTEATEQPIRWQPTLVRSEQLTRLEERQAAQPWRTVVFHRGRRTGAHLELQRAAEAYRELWVEREPAVRRVLEQLTEAMGITAAAAMDSFARVWADVVQAEQPDEQVDPRARALELRRTRNTGPSRDVVHQRRPRRVL